MKNRIKKYSIYVLPLLLIIPVFIILNNSLYAADSISPVIVYGNEKCGYCKDTLKWLEDQKIEFIYKDVELYGTNQEEMFAKLEKSGFIRTAHFPVLDVKGQILMKPKFDDISIALSGQKINDNGEKKIRSQKWRPEKNKSHRSDFNSIKNSITQSDIIFYDDGSGSGRSLLNQLKKEKIPFTHRQLNRMNNAAYFDMSVRLAALGYGNVTLFPVIEVRGEMIMKPSIKDVKMLIIEMTAE